MKMRNSAIGFHMEPDCVFAVGQIGRTVSYFLVLVFEHLFVKLFSEILSKFLPVFNGEVLGMFG